MKNSVEVLKEELLVKEQEADALRKALEVLTKSSFHGNGAAAPVEEEVYVRPEMPVGRAKKRDTRAAYYKKAKKKPLKAGAKKHRFGVDMIAFVQNAAMQVTKEQILNHLSTLYSSYVLNKYHAQVVSAYGNLKFNPKIIAVREGDSMLFSFNADKGGKYRVRSTAPIRTKRQYRHNGYGRGIIDILSASNGAHKSEGDLLGILKVEFPDVEKDLFRFKKALGMLIYNKRVAVMNDNGVRSYRLLGQA